MLHPGSPLSSPHPSGPRRESLGQVHLRPAKMSCMACVCVCGILRNNERARLSTSLGMNSPNKKKGCLQSCSVRSVRKNHVVRSSPTVARIRGGCGSSGPDFPDLGAMIRLLVLGLARASRAAVVAVPADVSTAIHLDSVALAGDAEPIAAAGAGALIGQRRQRGRTRSTPGAPAGEARADARGWASGRVAVQGGLLKVRGDLIYPWSSGIVGLSDATGSVRFRGLGMGDLGG